MKSILFICPYIGKLPVAHMKLWLKSCAYNPTINWLLIIDDKTKELEYPSNVKVVYMTFEEIKARFQSSFDFPICIEKPYKFCDFKPSYGFVFEEYAKSYDYWGHCDITDCLFGNLRKFLTDELLSSYDKLGFLGHMTIYRNTEEVNKRIFLPTKSNIPIEEIYNTKENLGFDENLVYGINAIYREHGFDIGRIDEIYRDIKPLYFNFHISTYDKSFKRIKQSSSHVFEWNNGKLYDVTAKNNSVNKYELGYVHFQKRIIDILAANSDSYYLIPNKIVNLSNDITTDFIIESNKRKLFYKPYFRLRYKNLKYRVSKILHSLVSTKK